IELKGEGVLKKAYLELKNKLEGEGVFAFERKKALPTFPQNIGVITSKKGAVINDLLSNLGQFGFRVKMIDSRVEGQEAVKELLGAVKGFKKQKLDVLLIMRGGGSLESLQAFNNEALVRAILNFPCPIIAAIGHDKDVPLLALATDFACSTPTAAANTLNKTWETAPLTINKAEHIIFEGFKNQIIEVRNDLWRFFTQASSWFDDFFAKYKNLESKNAHYLLLVEQALISRRRFLKDCWQKLENDLSFAFKGLVQKLIYLSQTIKAHDPENNLALGYCLAKKAGKVVRSIKSLKAGEDFSLQLADGTIQAKTT
ncbi:MAG: exodeoxyribonuclease VII large subunit, partial [bacterium]|nr:exodeoxyribonuclease VII large subunit [bacterium]